MHIKSVLEQGGTRYVLTQGRIGQIKGLDSDYAAYYGGMDMPAIEIAAHGEKLTTGRALELFSSILKDESQYRK